MGKSNYLILGLFVILLIVLGLFSSSQKARAADADVFINEIMANPQGADTNHEWLEIYNFGSSDLDLKDWQLKIYNDPTSISPTKTIKFTSIILPSNNFLVVVNDSVSYKPCGSCLAYSGGSFAITNAKGKIALANAAATWEHVFTWTEDVGKDGDGWSMEIIGPPQDPNYEAWLKTLNLGGTPGAKNSVSGKTAPQSPTLVSPADLEKFTAGEKVSFSWQEADLGCIFEIIVSKNGDLSDPIIDEPNLSANIYEAEDLEQGIYYWQIIASNGVYQTPSLILSFEITPLVYSDAIIINELYPNPADAAENEWIELYNNSSQNVDLKDWMIADLKGSVHQYKIPSGTNILANGYLIIKKTDSGITLNNDQDGARLTRPDGQTLYETPIFSGGGSGWGFARNSSGTWEWTTKITPAAANVISPPVTEEPSVTDEEENNDVPINQNPIVIKTGEFRSYENYLVTITGTVVETSGNTFYLDDGSGQAKVYIQDFTGIEKPSMHKGDVFEVTGIVNLYRDTFRILPRKQDDIQLIQAIQTANQVVSSSKKTTVTTAAKTTSTSSNATARAPTTNKQVASAANSKNSDIQVAAVKSPFWVQSIKAIIGLTIILLALFIIKIIKIRRTVPATQEFGDET